MRMGWTSRRWALKRTGDLLQRALCSGRSGVFHDKLCALPVLWLGNPASSRPCSLLCAPRKSGEPKVCAASCPVHCSLTPSCGTLGKPAAPGQLHHCQRLATFGSHRPAGSTGMSLHGSCAAVNQVLSGGSKTAALAPHSAQAQVRAAGRQRGGRGAHRHDCGWCGGH